METNGRNKVLHFVRGVAVLSLFSLCLLLEYTIQGNKSMMTSTQGVEHKPKKVAYLTFDDGPGNNSQELLDVLKKEKVHATFFLIGNQVNEDTDAIIKREYKEGHEIGVHTYSHEAGEIYSSADAYYADAMKAKRQLEKRYHRKVRLWRFPWGSANCYIKPYKKDIIDRLHKKGMEYVDWNVSGEDSVGTPTVDSILCNLRKDYKKYDDPVLLLHDSASHDKTIQAVKIIIPELKKAGYSFDVLSHRKKSCHFGEYN